MSAHIVFLEQSSSSLLAPLCAISTCFLCVVVVHHVGTAVVGLRALWHLSRHCHANHLQPALLELLAFGSKVVDGLGLREAEAGRRVRGPGTVIHRVAQEGDRTLGLHVLRRGVRDEQIGISMDGFQMNMGNDIFCFMFLVIYLRSSIEIEHQTLLLGDNAPHLLPRFVLLTVLQEATHDAAACELSRLDLHGGEINIAALLEN